MLLAEHIPQAPNLGWWLGLGIAFAVVVVVVAVVAALLMYASRINDQTQEALEAAEGAREGTEPLSRAKHTADAATRVLEAVTQARPTLLEAARAEQAAPPAEPAREQDERATSDEGASPGPEEETLAGTPARLEESSAFGERASGGEDEAVRREPAAEPGSRRGMIDRLRRLAWRRLR